ncbi:MAG TPA: hypothetical protein VKH44_07335 [Pirellulaceae bacterium]|nr:hypothetical protein [Pirellulaceae bacterium]
MSSPSRENLLGYLLQSLAPDEHEQVEAELNQNPTLRAEMRRLEACLGQIGLGDEPERLEPPAGLAARTCQFVAAQTSQTVTRAGALVIHGAERERRFTWSDFVTTAAVVVAAASLFFPALSFSRFQAQIATCQNQLRLIGFGLHEYSDRQPDHSFPGPEVEGNRAAAGIVAPLLVSRKLADSRMFLCPASSVLHDIADFRVPLPEELDRAVGQELKAMKRSMGGDYGFNMGYVEDGKLLRACNARRGGYVLAGDAPSNSQPRRVSGNHRGRGQNVLYEDGRVQFLPHLPSPQILDDPYHNRDGWVSAGLDRDDAVLGASNDPPLPVTLIDDGGR